MSDMDPVRLIARIVAARPEKVRRTRLGYWEALGWIDLDDLNGWPVWSLGFTRAQAVRRWPRRAQAEQDRRHRAHERRRKKDATWKPVTRPYGDS